jgi:hypothetical protein
LHDSQIGRSLGLAICGCAPALSRTSRPVGSTLYQEEIAFIRADSALFAAVVRGQLAGTEKEPPYHMDPLRFDARPYGNDSAYSDYLNDFEFEDSTFPGLIRREVMQRIIANRRSILADLNVTEGGPISAPSCPGILVPPPPPPPPARSPNDSSYARELAKLRAGCPKKADNYVSVSLPIRSLTKSVQERLKSVGLSPNLPGEVWTSLVETTNIGPGGAMWTMYLWLFQRDPSKGALKLAKTVLYGIAE